MKRVKRKVSVAGLTLLVFAPVFADTPNDDDKYRGDMLRYSFRTYATVAGKDENGKSTTEVFCIPAMTEMRGIGKVAGTNNLKVRISKGTPGAVPPDKDALVKTIKSCDMPKKDLYTDLIYIIEGGLADNQTPDRYGVTYGALVVPYKYHFEGSKSFGGNASVGPFVGYRFARETMGVTLKAIGFAGASVIKVDREEEGQTKSDNIAAFSYGAGVIMELKNEFQLGWIFGFDEVGDDTGYEDDGKLWTAFAIGFAFGT